MDNPEPGRKTFLSSGYYILLTLFQVIITNDCVIHYISDKVKLLVVSHLNAKSSKCLTVTISFLTAPPTVRIIHSGLACNIEEERYSERVYTIREGETLELTCLVTGHPRPQVSKKSS